jgi:hypothetical protein
MSALILRDSFRLSVFRVTIHSRCPVRANAGVSCEWVVCRGDSKQILLLQLKEPLTAFENMVSITYEKPSYSTGSPRNN